MRSCLVVVCAAAASTGGRSPLHARVHQRVATITCLLITHIFDIVISVQLVVCAHVLHLQNSFASILTATSQIEGRT
jgi:hypothetical protein